MQQEILQGSPALLPFSIRFYCFYSKWGKKITQQRKWSICRSMAMFSIRAFPMSQGPSCALTHPAGLLWLVGQSHGCAQHRETPRENRGETASQELPQQTQLPRHFLPGYRCAGCSLCSALWKLWRCWKAALWWWAQDVWRSSDSSERLHYNKYPNKFSISQLLLKLGNSGLSLRSDSSWGCAYRAHSCSHKTPHLDTFILE